MFAMIETMVFQLNSGDTYKVDALPFVVDDTFGTDYEELRFRPKISQMFEGEWALLEYLKSEENAQMAIDAGFEYIKQRQKEKH